MPHALVVELGLRCDFGSGSRRKGKIDASYRHAASHHVEAPVDEQSGTFKKAFQGFKYEKQFLQMAFTFTIGYLITLTVPDVKPIRKSFLKKASVASLIKPSTRRILGNF